MQTKVKLLVIPVLAVSSLGFVLAASAQESVAVKTEKTVETQNVKGNGNSNASVNQQQTAVTTTTTATTATEAAVPQDKTKKVKENKGKLSGDSHKSAVASFVQSLLAVADREGGIGQEVRTIAEQQNEVKDRAADLINAVEGRSKIKTFFIGTSYKNLGELRSQMVQVKNQIEQLKRLSDKAENPQDKAELQTQIQTLEQEQSKIEGFITQNESKFSLFGWAVKLFRK